MEGDHLETDVNLESADCLICSWIAQSLSSHHPSCSVDLPLEPLNTGGCGRLPDAGPSWGIFRLGYVWSMFDPSSISKAQQFVPAMTFSWLAVGEDPSPLEKCRKLQSVQLDKQVEGQESGISPHLSHSVSIFATVPVEVCSSDSGVLSGCICLLQSTAVARQVELCVEASVKCHNMSDEMLWLQGGVMFGSVPNDVGERNERECLRLRLAWPWV